MVRIKMICFFFFSMWMKETKREESFGFLFFFLNILICPFSREPFMVLRVICVLRAFLLL